MHGVALVGSQSLEDWQPMTLLDMSVSGVSVTQAPPLKTVSSVPCVFGFPKIVSCVTWGVPSDYRVGAIFLSLEQSTEQVIVIQRPRYKQLELLLGRRYWPARAARSTSR